ncbi:35440_t:CDS:1, partial [Gigaspora margarita]
DKEECEKKFRKIGTPVCFLCDKKHWRCKDNKYINCCNLNKCNDIECSYCKEYRIKCEQPFPRTQEDFENFKTKITHINWQIEASNDERLHSQVYVQLKIRIMMKAIKELFDDHSMFIEAIKTTSLLACMYCKKPYDYYKKHEGCKYDYYNLSLFCDLCDETCERKLARWERGELSEEITGPFEFGKFREIEKYTKVSLRSKKYKDKEYESIIEGNKMLIEEVHPLKVFKRNAKK